MAKLTKAQTKAHQAAEALLALDRPLTIDERWEVYEHWNEAASHNVTTSKAFFTPVDMAADAGLHYHGGTLIDLCAGIGVLTFGMWLRGGYFQNREPIPRTVCVEMNPDYVAIGKKLLPEAEWICGDVFSLDYPADTFDQVVSNPPFGTQAMTYTGNYTGRRLEYRVIETGMRFAKAGVFVLPSNLAPFKMSGQRGFDWAPNTETTTFTTQTGYELRPNLGIDTTCYEWKNTKVSTEIVLIEPNEE